MEMEEIVKIHSSPKIKENCKKLEMEEIVKKLGSRGRTGCEERSYEEPFKSKYIRIDPD